MGSILRGLSGKACLAMCVKPSIRPGNTRDIFLAFGRVEELIYALNSEAAKARAANKTFDFDVSPFARGLVRRHYLTGAAPTHSRRCEKVFAVQPSKLKLVPNV